MNFSKQANSTCLCWEDILSCPLGKHNPRVLLRINVSKSTITHWGYLLDRNELNYIVICSWHVGTIESAFLSYRNLEEEFSLRIKLLQNM